MESQGQGNTGTNMSRKEKLVTSSVIWYCTFALGVGWNLVGPALLDLTDKFETDIATISKVFTILTFSYLVGATTCGILFNYVNRQLATIILVLGMGLGAILLPIVPSLTLFFGAAVLLGFSTGGYDTAKIVWTLEMWQNNAAVYVQIQSFSYAVGSVVSPLVMKAFVSDHDRLLRSNTSKDEMLGPNLSFLYSTLHEDHQDRFSTVLYIPFLISGIITVFGAFLFLALYCVKKYEKPAKIDIAVGDSKKCCNFRKLALIGLASLIFGTYGGMEITSTQFLPTFTHFIPLALSQSQGALVLAGLTGAFTVGRGLGIFVTFKIVPELLLLVNLILIIVGNTLLLFYAGASLPILWIAVVLLGMGFSTVYPSMYGFIEKHLKVSNIVGALFTVADGLVCSIYPIIIGTSIDKNPFVLMYTNYFSLIVCTTAFLVVFYITKDSRRTCKDASSTPTVKDEKS